VELILENLFWEIDFGIVWEINSGKLILANLHWGINSGELVYGNLILEICYVKLILAN